jgi:polyphosphate kinase
MNRVSAPVHATVPETKPHATSGAVDVAAVPPRERFINRELSWLAFNTRVLEEARNMRNPILERVRFLSISASNLDEFYMVRVAGLKGQVNAGVTQVSADGLTPQEQLDQINEQVRGIFKLQDEIWDQLQTQLVKEGIEVVPPDGLTTAEREFLEQRFLEHFFPVLTPLAIDPAHPFPFIPNLGHALILQLVRIADGETMRALMPIPPQLERFVRLKGEGARFILLEDVLRDGGGRRSAGPGLQFRDCAQASPARYLHPSRGRRQHGAGAGQADLRRTRGRSPGRVPDRRHDRPDRSAPAHHRRSAGSDVSAL